MEILHNNRCSKSREAVCFLEDKKHEFSVRNYLENPLSEDEIKLLISKLSVPVMDIIRTNEPIWKEQYKGREYTDAELVKILVENPKLLQRPIVIKGDVAVVGRPIENIIKLLGE